MTERCEPPEHLRGVDGWHVVWRRGQPECIRWRVIPWKDDGAFEWHYQNDDWSPVDAAKFGWRYGGPAPGQSSAPVPSPEAVARLVEAGRRMSECDLGLIPEEGCTCETCEAWHALRAALAAFPEPQP